MDLISYARVVRRFAWLIALGILLAIALAVLSVARINRHGLTYRTPEVWQSETSLLLTQGGFPWGRTAVPANLGSLASLTELYSQFANSDAVLRAMRREGAPTTWQISAAAETPSNPYNATLPVILLFGTAQTPLASEQAVAFGRKAFLDYVIHQQETAAIPLGQRVLIQTLTTSQQPQLIKPHKKTLPIVVFLAVLTLTFGLAFVLDNARPRPAKVAIAPGSKAAGTVVARPNQTL